MRKYHILPVSKPRMTRSDRWKGRPPVLRYWAFRDEVNALNVDFKEGELIEFHIPMPKSWSKKKREEHLGQLHRSRPDIDNLVKALLDALYGDDSHIAEIHARKVWSEKGAIIIKTP